MHEGGEMNVEPSKSGAWGVSSARPGPSRWEFLIGLGGLLVLGAAGCGAGGSGDKEAGGEESKSGGTRTIDHKYGSTEISGIPKRVVTVGFSDQDAVLALGLVPVGVP